jgi:hypothetical protein
MNLQAHTPTIVIADHDAANRKLLARKAAAKTDHIESASRKVAITLCSPEGKRLYLRYFEITQINFHYITVFARIKVSWQDVEKFEQELRALLDNGLTRVNQALVDTAAKCVASGVTSLATYDVEPLGFDAKVFSTLDRRLLDLIEKVDQLMPMLETLCIEEVLTPSQLIIEKLCFKKTVRGVAREAHIIRGSLERRANTASAK